ncbi:hypothetical protein BHM03_00052490 [Ensete ventricosum]|nr:hypothetical protein BHM03_00052490 [Ensete ventricosum]
MMLKVFPDDDLGSTTHDRKKEYEKGIHMTPIAMMSSISMLALPEWGNVEGSEEEGWPTAASPHARPATHGQAGCKGQPVAAKAPYKGGDQPRPKPLAGATASIRGHPWAWLALAGATPTGIGSAHGQVTGGGFPLRCRKGQPDDQGCRLQGRPHLQGQRPRKSTPPAHEVPPKGSSAYRKGDCPCRRRVGQ